LLWHRSSGRSHPVLGSHLRLRYRLQRFGKPVLKLQPCLATDLSRRHVRRRLARRILRRHDRGSSGTMCSLNSGLQRSSRSLGFRRLNQPLLCASGRNGSAPANKTPAGYLQLPACRHPSGALLFAAAIQPLLAQHYDTEISTGIPKGCCHLEPCSQQWPDCPAVEHAPQQRDLAAADGGR
jgi:hypothetical protein